MKLYELSAEYARLSDLAEGGEDIECALAELTDAIDVKAKGIAYVLRGLDADETAIDAEISRLRARRDAIVTQREKLRDYLRANMERAGINKIKSPSISITLSDGPPRVIVEDESLVPENFVRTKREVDKQAIVRTYRLTGEMPAGVKVECFTTLRIR